MFWFTKNRHAEKIAKFVWPYISRSERWEGLDIKDSPFLFGFITASANIGFTINVGRPPNDNEFGDMVMRVLYRLYPDRFIELSKMNLNLLEINDLNHSRGADAANVLWGLSHGLIDPEGDPDLKRIKATLPPYDDDTLAAYGVEMPEDEHSKLLMRLFMEVGARIHREISGGPEWNGVDTS